MSDQQFNARKPSPEVREIVATLVTQFINRDPKRECPTIANYVTVVETGERMRSLAAKQFGRGLFIWDNANPDDPNALCQIWAEAEDPTRIHVRTTDPRLGHTEHVVVQHDSKPWEVFGVQKEAGNRVRLTEPAFNRWANVFVPVYDPDGKPQNLAAMNEQNAKHLPSYRARFADMACDKHLLAAQLAIAGTVFNFPLHDGEIVDYVLDAIALGYEDEQKSEIALHSVTIA